MEDSDGFLALVCVRLWETRSEVVDCKIKKIYNTIKISY